MLSTPKNAIKICEFSILLCIIRSQFFGCLRFKVFFRFLAKWDPQPTLFADRIITENKNSVTNFLYVGKFAKIQAGYERIFCKWLIIIIIIIANGGILSLTDSHHHHHGQIPTMVPWWEVVMVGVSFQALIVIIVIIAFIIVISNDHHCSHEMIGKSVMWPLTDKMFAKKKGKKSADVPPSPHQDETRKVVFYPILIQRGKILCHELNNFWWSKSTSSILLHLVFCGNSPRLPGVLVQRLQLDLKTQQGGYYRWVLGNMKHDIWI